MRQATAAVASRGAVELGSHAARRGSSAGPRVDLGPGSGRWRKAVAVAAEAVASTTGVSEMVVLVTPKGNCRGRVSLVEKVMDLGGGGGSRRGKRYRRGTSR